MKEGLNDLCGEKWRQFLHFFPLCLPQSLIFEIGVRYENKSQSKPYYSDILMVEMISGVDEFFCV